MAWKSAGDSISSTVTVDKPTMPLANFEPVSPASSSRLASRMSPTPPANTRVGLPPPETALTNPTVMMTTPPSSTALLDCISASNKALYYLGDALPGDRRAQQGEAGEDEDQNHEIHRAGLTFSPAS